MTSRLEKQMGNLRGKTLEIIEAAPPRSYRAGCATPVTKSS